MILSLSILILFVLSPEYLTYFKHRCWAAVQDPRRLRDSLYLKLGYQLHTNQTWPEEQPRPIISKQWGGATLDGAELWRLHDITRTPGCETALNQIGMEKKNRRVVYSHNKQNAAITPALLAIIKTFDSTTYTP